MYKTQEILSCTECPQLKSELLGVIEEVEPTAIGKKALLEQVIVKYPKNCIYIQKNEKAVINNEF